MRTDRLLIGTDRALVYWDGREAHTVLRPDEGLIYGVTWDGERVYVTVGGTVLTLDRRLEPAGEVEFGFPLRDPHQALWYDGALYVTDAQRNQIVEFREGEVTVRGQEILPYGRRQNPHVNSIWCDGERFYIVEHWKTIFPKRVRVFDRGWNCVGVVEFWQNVVGWKAKPNGLHNVYVERGTLTALGAGRIIRHEMGTGRSRVIKQEAFEDCYLRGLARTAGRYYVGASPSIKARKWRLDGDCTVFVFDDGFAEVGRIELKGLGQCKEVRALVVDRAHNGVDWELEVGS